MMKTRNHNIDFLRGVAALWIIVIHTAFWSGEGYLPSFVTNLTLFLDVPVFIFISGVSFNYVNSIIKNIKGILEQWKKWIYFIIFYTLILLIFFRESFEFKEIFSWLTYTFPSNNPLPVVQGSIWYMIMYIKVTVLCSIIICIVNSKFKENKLKILKMILQFFLLLFMYTSFSKNNVVFDSYVYYYSIIYLFGYIINNYKIKNIKCLIFIEGICILLLSIILNIFNLSISDLQSVKFPPSLPYLFVSSMSIILFWYLKDNLKIKQNNIINYVGRNAIFYYFSQGVSSSLIYFIYPYIPFDNIIIKFIIMLISNVIITAAGALFLDKSYTRIKNQITSNNKIDNMMNNIKNKFIIEK